jgi:putative transposase
MSAPDRRRLVDRKPGGLSIRQQCELLGLARSGLYRLPAPANDSDLALMRRIDELFTAWPFLGSRRMAVILRAESHGIKRKRVQRLMRKMGIAALGPEATHKQAGARAQDIPVSAARCGNRAAEPGLVRRHHLHPHRAGLPLSRRDHGLDEPGGAGVAVVQHHGQLILRLGAAGCASALRPAGDLQHRPGQPVHQYSLHWRADGRRRAHLDNGFIERRSARSSTRTFT